MLYYLVISSQLVDATISYQKDPEPGWIPLDEYYYGKKEGDPSYREEKKQFRFKVFKSVFDLLITQKIKIF